MPLGTRDITLIIRAQDQASRVLRNIGREFSTLDNDARESATRQMQSGGALIGMGVLIGGVGVLGLKVAKDWTDAAIEYNRQTALTMTQVDQVGISLQQLGQIGLDVAKKVPAPLDQMQAALFDIFSSMDVDAPQAQKLLTGFAKAAVAGQVDIQKASRASISIMNAYGLTTDDLGHVLDVQFQLVRKGVGTYDEFSSSIGKAIPSARRAGQNIETLAGSMAFLTRNGLSASMSATSAARAFDNLTKPEVIKNMGELGIKVLDNEGHIRQMNDIATDLGKTLDGLTDAQKAAALDKIFKGSGNNIQARRFWDLAIRNYQQLNGLVGDMVNSKGALEDAYKIMFDQPAVQSQLLKNNLSALKIELGQALIPIFNQLLQVGRDLLGWFNDMSPHTKALIGQIVVIGSIVAIAVGALLIFVGALETVAGAIAFITGTEALSLGPLLLVILAIAGAALLIQQNWDTIKGWWNELWPSLKKTAQDVWDWMKAEWTDLWPKIKAAASDTWDWIKTTWAILWPQVKQDAIGVWNWIVATWDWLWPHVKSIAESTWAWLKSTWSELWPVIKEVAGKVWDWLVARWDWLWPHIKEAAKAVWDWIPGAWNTAVAAIKKGATWFWTTFGPALTKVFDFVKDHWQIAIVGMLALIDPWIAGAAAVVLAIVYWKKIKPIVDEVWSSIKGFWDHVKQVWDWFHDTFGPGFKTIWDGFSTDALPIIKNTVTLLGMLAGVLIWVSQQLGLFDIVTQSLKITWETFAGIIKGALDIISGILQFFVDLFTGKWGKLWGDVEQILTGAWEIIWATIKGFVDGIILVLSAAWDLISTIAVTFWKGFTTIISGLWEDIKGVFKSVVDAIEIVLSTAWDAIKSVAETAWNGIKTIADTVWGGITGAISSPIDTLKTILSDVWSALETAAETAWSFLKGTAARIWNEIQDVIKNPIDALKAIVQGIWDAIKTAADITWNAIKSVISVPVEAIKTVIHGITAIIQGVIDKWNELKDAISKGIGIGVSIGVGGVSTGPQGKVVPKAKVSALGRYVDTKTLTWVGEAGRELILPMNNMKRASDLIKYAASRNPQFAQLISPGVVPMSGSGNIVIHPGAMQISISGVSDDMANLVEDTLKRGMRELATSVRTSVKGPFG